MPHPKICYSTGFCLMLALVILLIPFSWLMAMLIAAAFHECCHLLTIRCLTGQKATMWLSSYTARIGLPDMPVWKECLCALAGPAGSLLLLILSATFPRVAVCGLFQALYNLIPISPMDGGRALECILHSMLSPPAAEGIVHILAVIFHIILLSAGLYGCFYLRLGVLPLILSVLICIRAK